MLKSLEYIHLISNMQQRETFKSDKSTCFHAFIVSEVLHRISFLAAILPITHSTFTAVFHTVIWVTEIEMCHTKCYDEISVEHQYSKLRRVERFMQPSFQTCLYLRI